MSGAKSKSPSPPRQESLSKTILAMPRDGWNQSMKNTCKTIAELGKKEAEKNMNLSTAVLIAQSFDTDSCESCLKKEDLRKLIQIFNEQEKTKNPAKDSPAGGVDERASSNKTQGPANAQELKKQEPVQGQKSLIATGGASGNKTQGPANASKLKKPEPEQGQKSDIATGGSNPANIETLLVKRTEELNESEKECKKREEECKKKEEECKNLCEKIEEKDQTLQNLDGEVKKLKTAKKVMEIELKKAMAERDERQSMVQNMERLLEKLNSDNTDLVSKKEELLTENGKLKEERSKTANDIKKLTSEKFALESNIEKYKKHMEKLYRDNQKKLDDLIEDNEKEMRSLNNKLSEIIKERDDLKTRFSKLAGAKLTDQNADIADLSDPNRAMKVSERFGQLYDDEWTDAFEELKKKKMDGKDAIQLLLRILKECHAFCNNLKEVQIDSLNNVLLHPSQDITKFANEHRKNVGGLKERPRISSKDEKAVRNLRRQIGVSNTCIEEVKQVFVLETKSWVDKGCDKKLLEVCKPYLEKCAEVCWLMVLHDPPLYMKMDASEGDKMDPNLYTVYSTSGDKIRYLVWPPLYNEAGGGLISKGVAECVKVIKKN